MRVNIREQLAALSLLIVLVSVAIVSLPTWFFVYRFVVDVRTEDLAQVASLKASQIGALMSVFQSTCTSITTRLFLQQNLADSYIGNATYDRELIASQTLQAALVSSGFVDLLQAQVYSRNSTAGSDVFIRQNGSPSGPIKLPYQYPNGTSAMLGDPGLGYPPDLYPNFTHPINDPSGASEPAAAFPDINVTSSRPLLLGPLQVNASYALISLTLPIFAIGNSSSILGYLTVVASAGSIFNIEASEDVLGSTGKSVIIGPDTKWNRFDKSLQLSDGADAWNSSGLSRTSAKFILPLSEKNDQKSRPNQFPLTAFPLALKAFSSPLAAVDPEGDLNTHNELGEPVSVGYARLRTKLVDWVVVVEQARSDAYAPIDTLQKILLACVFSTLALALILILPCAHFSVLPIRRLKAATEASIAPRGSSSSLDVRSPPPGSPPEDGLPKQSRGGIWKQFKGLLQGRAYLEHENRSRHSAIRIPNHVKERKHYISDELTDLTKTFNEMSDELYVQYMHLEEKVAERTKELEISKKAAEAANESKTLFIANMSHELKTPLNGILGTCAVCMEENDIGQIQGSLKTVYESGNLLLRLLDDLLSFSRNQVGQGLSLEKSEFQLQDIGQQISAIFLKSAREKLINLSVVYTNGIHPSHVQNLDTKPKALLPHPLELAALKDVRVSGDQHRVLQILLNLVGNSLKFTPENGSIKVTIKCIGRANAKAADLGSTPDSSDTGHKEPQVSGLLSEKDVLTQPQPTAAGPEARKTGRSLIDTQSTVEHQESGTPKRIESSRSSWLPSESEQYLFEFAVEDTGQGIHEDMQQRVFEPFIQGDSRLSKKFGGAGLGLTICRQLAHLMGGSITLSSHLGMGTSVYLHVPLTLASQEASQVDVLPNEETPVTTEEVRVLIADDNPVNIEVVRRMLKLENIYNITTAKDGQEAFDLVKANFENNQQYTVIFMDIQMPRLDGLESTVQIRNLGYSAPIVALTASAEKDILTMSIDSGMDTVMSKPIRRPALKQVLSAFVGVSTVPKDKS